jgi:hypothetical protein
VSKSRFPGATWAPIPEHGEGPSYTKTQLIFHSTGTRASAAANRRYFARGDVDVESTLIVDYDGGALQILEAGERADANGSANRRAISVEVVGEAHEPYTAAQVATCRAIAEWACSEHPIARRQIPEHDASGVGWHVMFGAPGPWTSVRGKACPGSRRIAQVRDLIIPGLLAAPTVQEDDVSKLVTADDKTLYLAHPWLGARHIVTMEEFWAEVEIGAIPPGTKAQKLSQARLDALLAVAKRVAA